MAPSHLEPVEKADWCQRTHEAVKKGCACCHERLCLGQLDDELGVRLPPGCRTPVFSSPSRAATPGSVGHEILQVWLRGDRGGEVVVVGVTLDEDVHRVEAVRSEEVRLVGDLALGDTANEVGAHVLRLGRRCVVGVAADIEVDVVGEQLIVGDDRSRSRGCR